MKLSLRAVAVAAAALAVAGSASAQSEVTLSLTLPQTESVPPYAGPRVLVERQLPGRVRVQELVDVGLAPNGAVASVTVEQRLRLQGVGDLFLSIPAPTTDVEALPESESLPGRRRFAVVWQGFSSRGKTLAARIGVRAQEVEHLLPVRVTQVTEGSVTRLTLTPDAALSVPTYRGGVQALALAQQLDDLLAAARRGVVPSSLAVRAAGEITGQTLAVRPAFRVRGTMKVRSRVVRVDEVLDGRPATLVTRWPARGTPAIDLEVVPLDAATALAPPAGGTWREALEGNALPRGEKLLTFALTRLLASVATDRYNGFLEALDPRIDTTTRYRYRSVDVQPIPTSASPVQGDDETLALALAIGLGVLGGAAALVLWAHA